MLVKLIEAKDEFLIDKQIENCSNYTLNAIFRAFKKHTGYNVHDARRYFACEMLRKGISIYDLKTLMNHSSVAVTERYVREFSLNSEEIAKRVNFSPLSNL